jgi:Fe-S cluster biosynthesis and repair protein YggX
MDDKIEQFRKMAAEDPDNELGHFSLGKALIDARRFEEAVEPLQQVIALNPGYSRAYQLLGSALNRLGRRDETVDVLTRGFQIADERGDVMPRDVMGKLLESLGQTPPPIKTGSRREVESVADAGFQCRRCQVTGNRLPAPPFRGALGQKVYDTICAQCWSEWVAVGTKVINELRLRLSDPRSQEVYDQHMIEYLQLE